MKNVFFVALFCFASMAVTAQQKPSKTNSGGSTVEEKANHNTTRSNRKTGARMGEDNDADGDEDDQAAIFERRKCIRSGGTYYVYPSGIKRCMYPTTKKKGTLPNQPMKGIFERRKCLKSGGVWATNANGSFCFKTIPLNNQ